MLIHTCHIEQSDDILFTKWLLRILYAIAIDVRDRRQAELLHLLVLMGNASHYACVLLALEASEILEVFIRNFRRHYLGVISAYRRLLLNRHWNFNHVLWMHQKLYLLHWHKLLQMHILVKVLKCRCMNCV